MAVQNLSGIESMLRQMREAVRAAGAGAEIGASQAPSAPGGFAAELQRSIRRVSEAQKAANAQAQAFELGEPGISLNDVMIDIQKASLAFQGAVQVRNRLVAAYQEIASMSV
ncbi:flagellar hook-basal body complex protein FliE [Orrella sp. JC864]|uniref:flagellar hook-basal body complex protein FliE n=1 Tax=Orrella sp. JC864 TaxID=3120298 RepID=UPI0012BC0618